MSQFSSEDPSLKYPQAEVEDEFTLKCSACGRNLVDIMLEQGIKHTTLIQAQCPCGDHSFSKKIENGFRFSPCDKLTIIDIQYSGVILFKTGEI